MIHIDTSEITRPEVWDHFDSYARRLDPLGSVEFALYSRGMLEKSVRLLINDRFWWRFLYCLEFGAIFIALMETGLIPNLIVVLIVGVPLFIIIFNGFEDSATPRFAVCERGLWLEKRPVAWDRVRSCSWSRYRKNELVVSVNDFTKRVQIPADRCEEVEAAVSKHAKMRRVILQAAPITGGDLSEDGS
jgi:hypothetical protein